MGLRFIYGRAGSGKSYTCMQQISDMLKQGGQGPLILLVPEQYTLQAEKNMVKALGSTGLNGAEVLSFRRMAYRVFNEVGGVTRRHIDSAGKSMLLYRIIDGMKGDLKIFAKAARQQGFIGVIADTISEFKRYRIAPEGLLDACGSLGDKEILKEKLAELAKIYRAFEEALHERYIDSDDDLTLLAAKLDESTLFNGAVVWVDGFSGFTPQEYAVIEGLLTKARSVNICMCTDCTKGHAACGTGVFSPVNTAVFRLTEMAAQRGIAVQPPVLVTAEPPCRFEESLELTHLEREYFSFPCRRYPDKTEDISLLAAANIYSEVEDTARDILRLCRDKGLRYRDIAVVTRNPAGYDRLISSIFDEYGIPCFIDGKRDILGNPLVQYMLSALDIFINNWSYQSVFGYLKTGLSGIPSDDIDILENYVLACGIRGSAWTRQQDWTINTDTPFDDRGTTDYEKEMLARVNGIRHKVTAPLLELRAKTKGKKRVRDLCAALYGFLCDTRVPERIEERTARLEKSGELNLANEYRQVWGIVMQSLDQLVEVMGDEAGGIQDYRRVLEAGLNEYKIGLIPPALDQVLIGSIERSKSHQIKALYILGVNDGIFPAVSADEGILCDRDRENLRSIGVELAQDTRTKAFEEQYLIYSALTTAEKFLRISYPIADSNGRSMRPSIIISRLKKLFPQISEYSNIIHHNSDRDHLELVSAPLPTFNRLIPIIRRRARGLQTGSVWRDVHLWYTQNPWWSERYRAMLSGLTYSNQAAAIGREKAKRLYGSPLYTSVSRLERFAACPFAYYIQYGLKAKDRKVFGLTAPDMGTFIHNVIDRFSRDLREKGMTWSELDRERCRMGVEAIVDEILRERPAAILNSSPRYKYFTLRLKRILTRAVWLIAQHIARSGFQPLEYELAFGGEGEFPPIKIELDSGEKVYLTGRIDRVDVLEGEDGTYIRVIDYKSGNKDFCLSDVYHGLQIQLITYLDALWENGSGRFKQPVLPGGMLYFTIDDPIITNGKGLTVQEIEHEIMKKLKMKGLLLADVKLIKEMDREIDGSSLIIPARINKGDVLGKSSTVANAEQFGLLRSYVRNLLAKTAGEMLKGDVSISPYRKNSFTSCSYCDYSPVCQFDTGFADNRYRMLKDIDEQQLWRLLGYTEKPGKGEAE